MTALLLSGGMDSISILYWKKPDIALTIDYGQNCAKAEINAAEYACKILNIKHYVLSINCAELGSGDLSKNLTTNEYAPHSDWWPYRNQLLITFAAMYLLKFKVKKILIGSLKPDEQFKDGTDKFTKLISELISFQEGGIIVEAPAINMTAMELIEKSKIPKSILFCAHSCHKKNIPCGNCRGCNKFIRIFDKLEESKKENL
ncbi:MULTISPECIES: 7-cyano-7-deazaguanine synthase [Arcobacter]|uniref:7-cyano-7-deazaguanine synthase n=1 Tax=Arcobacter arenosus TaxID=2576037 RepID=A0A5R8XWY3_9BACT|nr:MULTISPECIES: 7-cyano-7-deazaguanine synthase [Arcobacter]RXK01174.1 7-cyano-7-deazaguanine synthase [Arcobacter sp. CECT 8986]TLP35519.1 7-cyano-7-deazaguanine synthase [Arcobacter arenosus]